MNLQGKADQITMDQKVPFGIIITIVITRRKFNLQAKLGFYYMEPERASVAQN